MDPPSRIGSAVIAMDQAMEVDKAKSIPMRTVAVSVSIRLLS